MALPVGQSLHLPRRGDGTIWTPDLGIVPGGDPYDMTPYSVPFAWSWPTPPSITNGEAVVTPATLAANNVNGRRLTLSPGSYGNVSPADDQEWILQAGALIDDFDFGGSHRLKVRGETPRVGRIGSIRGAAEGAGAGTTDILFDGIYQTNGSWTTGPGFASNAPAGHRVAIVNSSLNTASYTLFLGGTVANDFNNIIIAGNYIRNDNSIPISTTVSPQHAVRFMSVNTFIFAGNYIEKYDDGLIWRVHTNSVNPTVDTFNGFIGGNAFVDRASATIFTGIQVYPASSAYTPGNIYDLVFDGNQIHLDSGGCFGFDESPQPGGWRDNITNISILNNFCNGSAGIPSLATFPSFTISGNSSQSYNAGSIPTPQSILGWTP